MIVVSVDGLKLRLIDYRECENDVFRQGRFLTHLVRLLENFHTKGINLHFHTQAIDTTTPAGTALFHMMGIFSQRERSMIQERVRAGSARARAQGKQYGAAAKYFFRRLQMSHGDSVHHFGVKPP
jgi:DNA invertase Pin-like site-specific DNA recombinase